MNNFIFNKLRYNNVTDEENFNIKSIGDYLFEDIDIKKMSPSRFTYYKDLLDIYNKNPKILYNVLRKYYRFDELKSKEKKLLNNINFNQESYLKADKGVKAAKELLDKHLRDIKKKERDERYEREKEANTEENHKVPEKKVAETTKKDENDKIEKVAEATKKAEENLQKYIVVGGDIDIHDRNESILRDELKNNLDLFNIDNLSEPIIKQNVKYKTINKIKDFDEKIDLYNNDLIDDDTIKRELNIFDNDPKNPMKELEITFDDRLVFILTTFFIRYLSVILIQWCIDINFIKNFHEGFLYYAIIYLAILWFIILFVNIDNTIQVDYMNFDNPMNSIRSLFYYLYMGTNGITRLIIHSILIIILIFIPIILNIKSKEEEEQDDDDENNVKILNFEERKKLIKTLSLFTIFIWILTSIIATKF
jgi:hypothetical protein